MAKNNVKQLTEPQANRTRNKFKRIAHALGIVSTRLDQLNIKDNIVRTGLLLASEEADEMFEAIATMMNGNTKRKT